MAPTPAQDRGPTRRDALAALALAPFAAALRSQEPAAASRPQPDLAELAARLRAASRRDAFAAVAGLRRDRAAERHVLGAVFLAGITDVEPRPVGFQLHAVMMAAPAADLIARTPPSAPDTERWLPVFWNVADLKRAQAADRQRGDWSLPPRPAPAAGEPAAALRAAFAAGDDDAADRASVALAAATTRDGAFETIWPEAGGNYHNLGHMIIHAAQCHRMLAGIGWPHGETVLRALAYALLAGGEPRSAAAARRSRELAAALPAQWAAGECEPAAALALLRELRGLDELAAPRRVAAALGAGAGAATAWDALRLWSAEQLARRPGILAVHAVTSVNAFGIAARASGDAATRAFLLLQAAAWLGLYRQDLGVGDGVELDRLEPAAGAPRPADVFAAAAEQPARAPALALAVARDAAGREAFVVQARALLFHKAREHHDWKFAAAAFEETRGAHPALAPRLLAASLAYLRHPGDADSGDANYALEVMAG
jgi:hypothetical protein